MTRLLIANRGEIAIRIIRACRDLGISPVAVYSEADRTALHVRLADWAVPIGPAPARESYLVVEKILDAAKKTGATMLHPSSRRASRGSAPRRTPSPPWGARPSRDGAFFRPEFRSCPA